MSNGKRIKRGRPPVPARHKHVARGVSLSVQMEKLAMARANTLGLGFSGYVQALVEADLRNKTLTPLPEAA